MFDRTIIRGLYTVTSLFNILDYSTNIYIYIFFYSFFLISYIANYTSASFSRSFRIDEAWKMLYGLSRVNSYFISSFEKPVDEVIVFFEISILLFFLSLSLSHSFFFEYFFFYLVSGDTHITITIQTIAISKEFKYIYKKEIYCN